MDFLGGGLFFHFFKIFFVPKGQVLIGKAMTRFEPQHATLLEDENGHFWPKTAFLSRQGPWSPLKVPSEGPSCWRTGIQVINCLNLQFDGFWVEKNAFQSTLKIPIFAKIQVLTPFWPSRPLFLIKYPPNWPHMLLAHVLGPPWYLLGGPGS